MSGRLLRHDECEFSIALHRGRADLGNRKGIRHEASGILRGINLEGLAWPFQTLKRGSSNDFLVVVDYPNMK
jgi:hypothetical protein